VRSPTRSDAAIAAGAADVICVLAFVLAGRRSHDEGSGLGAVLEVAAPFLVALAVGWLVARAWRRPAELRTGVTVWIVTVVVGMVLRRAVFDCGTAVSFVVVATIVLGALLVGWRAAARAGLARFDRSTDKVHDQHASREEAG